MIHSVVHPRIRLVGLIAAVILGAAIITAPGCGRGNRSPNVLLITVDTLRPDHLGLYGYHRPTSPNIDALGAGGVRFDDAWSVAGWTLPSVATIMTGQYPKVHGATDFHWSLDPSLPSLASILRQHGYDTAGYVSHVMLTPTYGLGDGFAHYDYSVLDVGQPHLVSTAVPLTELALHGLSKLKKPWFLWIHYFDPHFAYLSHPAFASFGNTDIDRYDQEIAHTDYQIGRLLKHIDRGSTVIVFTADHGEEFGEHGGKYHYTLYNEVMRVPLVVCAPGLKPGVIRTPAEQIDIMPTILALAGVPYTGKLPGHDLFASPPPDRPLFIERDRPPPWRQRGVIQGDDKLFVVEMQDTMDIPPASRGTEIPVKNVHPGIYLYNLAADSTESTNLYRPNDPTALRLLGLVASHFANAHHGTDRVQLDKDLIRKLRSLGYVR